MARRDLIAELQSYPASLEERIHVARTIALLETRPDCFYRTCFEPGHITGSALLISADGLQVLMNHHAFLDKWLCFGGHADGDEDIAAVARRELVEESGITALELAWDGIFDVDVHSIPPNVQKSEPAHEHFDIRYLFLATGSADFTMSEESSAMKWCGFDEASALASDDSMRRLLRKWMKLERVGKALPRLT
jgi:8-oxo-dGTP pyrophosphatase MutT (NUDIX family)